MFHSRSFSKDNPEHIQCLSSLIIFLQTLVNETGNNIADLFATSDLTKNPVTLLCDKMAADLKNEREEEEHDEEENEENRREIILSLLDTLSRLATHFEHGSLAR